ncbi:mucin-2-like [Ochlerotatus camptorhynchus]|uniref:mucin-2-like n=1 Tax=Ochlerotatus camptorhynchus TaxID=644619 RepID=UPI0031D8B0DB
MKKKLMLLVCYVLLEISEHAQSVELECEKEGFAVVESENCGVYYYCVKSANDEFYAVKFECPLGEGFSLLKLKCIPEDNNDCGKLPDTPIDDPILSGDFVCPSSGHFPDVESPDCKSYYMCSNVLLPVLNNCPSTTIFSWVSMKCVLPTTFTCPNAITTTTEATTIPTEENTGPDSFVCITEGRFSDPQSVDCTRYYLCVTTIDGNIDAILYQCALDTVFSPETQKCVMSNQYECPATTSSAEPSTIEAATSTTTEESTSETREPNAFVCTDIGRVPDPASTDCTTYYLCTISIYGIYEAILYQCPSNTIFSPVDQKCLATGYQCSAGTTAMTDMPATIESTISYTTDIEVTTQNSSTSETTVTVEITTTTDTENQSTVSESTSASTTDHNAVTTLYPSSFICTSYGRFSDPESTDCKGYYLCTENTDGFFKATLNQCPSVTIFTPEKGKCVQPTDYQCPMVETTTPDPTKESSTVETTVSSSETPIVTTPEPSSTVLTTDYTFPSPAITTTNEPSTSETDEPTREPPGESFACPDYGRFPDPESTDCKGYYLCTENTDGFFKATLNQCPSVTIFTPEKGKCVQPTDYQCPMVETTTPDPTKESSTVETTVSSSETPIVTTPEPSSTVLTTDYTIPSPAITTTNEPSTSETDEPTREPPGESFACPNYGRFPDPESTDCKGYYLCTENTDGFFKATLNQCPSVTIFTPEKGKCVQPTDYQCPMVETTTPDPTKESSTVKTTVSSSETPIVTTPEPSSTVLTTDYTIPSPAITTTNEPSTSETDEPTREPPGESFACPDYGRFPDPESTDCKGYYLCTENTDGFFKATLNQCPSVTIFTPEKGKCVQPTDYQCPMVETTTPDPTKESSTVETTVSSSETPIVTTPEPSSTVLTTDYTIPSPAITTTNEPSTSETDEPTREPPGESFACPDYGRFPDPESTDCKGYYLCTENTDGFFKATLNQCPSVTIFTPEKGKCVQPTDYQCPMVETTTPDPTKESSTVETTVSSSETPIVTTPEPSSTVLTTDYTIPSPAITTTNEPSTSETDEPTREPPGESFACPDYGRFPDPESTDCKGYYLCTENTDGFFKATLNQCPSVTIFTPEKGKCVQPTDYQCPMVETTTPDPTKESSTVKTTVSSSETPIVTTPEPSSTVLTTDYTIPSPAITTTNEPSTSETDEPTREPPGESFACPDYGRFPDPESTDCKGYYLCTENTDGFFKATLNQCPSVTIFTPEKGKCVQPTDYQCPMVETTTPDPTKESSTVETTVSSSETPIVTTPEPSSTVLTTDYTIPSPAITTTNEPSTSETDEPTREPPGESFACPDYGRFPDPESTNCKGYYLCTENTDGFFKATLNQCPSVTIFTPEKGKCVQPTDYQCPMVETTTPDPTKESSTVETTVSSSETPIVTTPEPSTPVLTTQTPPTSESFVCTAVGRFPDPMSTDCKGYYLCSTTVAGVYETVQTQCPSITIFSAEQNRCVIMSQYQCPTATTTSTVEPTTQETTFTTPSIATSPGIFSCTSIGRHPDPSQPDCSKYKYCLLTATNEFLEYTFNCPSGSYFNPLELRCSIGYSCPALSPTVISEGTTELSLMTTPFYCTSDGRFPDPTSEGCDTYIMCLKTTVGNFQNYNFKCPSGSLFSPAEAKCSTSYLCI